MEELSLAGLDGCDLLNGAVSLDPFGVDFSVSVPGTPSEADPNVATEADLWQNVFTTDAVITALIATAPGSAPAGMSPGLSDGADTDAAMQRLELDDVFSFADASLPDLSPQQSGRFSGGNNSSFTDFTRALDDESGDQERQVSHELEQAQLMQENLHPKTSSNTISNNLISISAAIKNSPNLKKSGDVYGRDCNGSAGGGGLSSGTKKSRSRSSAANKSSGVLDRSIPKVKNEDPVKVSLTSMIPVEPETPALMDEDMNDDDAPGIMTSGFGVGKPRDKTTQRKLRNKESARRYREKQVAKRRQLEDYTRSLAEQNRELESLHEKLLSMTFGPGGVVSGVGLAGSAPLAHAQETRLQRPTSPLQNIT
jgi:hypothetical protein